MWQRDQASSASEPLVWAALLLLVVSPPALFVGAGGWLWLRARPSPRVLFCLGGLAAIGWLLLFLLRAAWLTLLAHLWHALVIAPSFSTFFGSLLLIWTWGLFLAPTAAMLLFVAPTPPVDQFQMQQRQRRAHQQRAEQAAARRLQRQPLPRFPDALTLGTAVGGDLPWIQQGWLALPAPKMGHLLVIGETGSGKTESILRLAVAARALGWQILYLDGKGNEATAVRFLAAMVEAGCRRVAYFPTQPYDGWRGSLADLYNRYLAIQPFSQEWYQRVAQLVLAWAIHANAQAPLSSAELLRRLDKSVLASLYQGKPQAPRIKALEREDVLGVYMRYQAFFSTVGSQLDGSWAFEDVEAAYLQLGGLALKAEANSLGQFFLEEAAQYIVQRKSVGVPVLLIVEEVSALQAATGSAADLFERARFYDTHVVVSSQSDAALGAEAERLLKASNTLIVHQYSYPEPLLLKAGKEMALEQSWQQDLWGRPTGRDVLRQKEVLRVAPDQVRQFTPGTAAVLSGGRSAIVRVAPVQVSPAALQQAQRWANAPTSAGPAPGVTAASQPKPTRPLGPNAAPGGGPPGFQPPNQLPGTTP
jgi:hypothetical protein